MRTIDFHCDTYLLNGHYMCNESQLQPNIMELVNCGIQSLLHLLFNITHVYKINIPVEVYEVV